MTAPTWARESDWPALKQQRGEKWSDYLVRLASYVPLYDRQSMTPSERRACLAAPPCEICGVEVALTEGGRLTVTHDYRAHHPPSIEPEPVRRRSRPERPAWTDALP